MTEESARKLAETLYSPFLANGLIDEKGIEMATRLILNHVELESALASLHALAESDDQIAPPAVERDILTMVGQLRQQGMSLQDIGAAIAKRGAFDHAGSQP